jgi:hypothetical protein
MLRLAIQRNGVSSFCTFKDFVPAMFGDPLPLLQTTYSTDNLISSSRANRPEYEIGHFHPYISEVKNACFNISPLCLYFVMLNLAKGRSCYITFIFCLLCSQHEESEHGFVADTVSVDF